MNHQCVFSADRVYRYVLWRDWSDMLTPASGYVQVIGLNPSTADETQDDPTIRRLIGFCKSWGYTRLCMTNLFAFRATDPKVMKSQPDPVGPENDRWLMEIARGASKVIAAWGNDGRILGRYRKVEAMIPRMECFGLTTVGQPKHPLYLPSVARLVGLPSSIGREEAQQACDEIDAYDKQQGTS